jgi:hypothetical protein
MDINDRIKDVDLHLVLGNQLFPISNLRKINPRRYIHERGLWSMYISKAS